MFVLVLVVGLELVPFVVAIDVVQALGQELVSSVIDEEQALVLELFVLWRIFVASIPSVEEAMVASF